VPKKYTLTLLASVAMIFTTACEMLPVIHLTGRGTSVSVPSSVIPQIPDPPSRVARISYVRGAVSFQAAGTQAWSRGELNRPAAEGDALWTDVADRAELQLGSAAIRMDARTRLDFLTFNDRTVQARVTLGVIGITVRNLAPGEALEVDTPNAAVTLLRPGEYRLDVQPEMDSTFVTVRAGEAEVTGTRVYFTLHAGQRANVSGPDAVEWGLAAAPAPDKFDEFCEMRDRREEGCISAQYVGPGTIGYSDLDESGVWRVDDELGALWTPSGLAAGWAPFRFGHWTWVELWGWTWIDDAPWGFAPFHYGRWTYLDGRWSWIPGSRIAQAIYAPALAVFVGGGQPALHGVAWFPLGPREVYMPPYRCSSDYLTSMNIGMDRPRQSYGNLSVDGAVTAVPRSVFVRGQPVARSVVPIPPRAASRARVTGTAPPIAPIEQSLSPRRDRYVLDAPEITQTVAGHRDPAPRPLSFRQRQPLLKAHPGRPLEQMELENLRKAIAEPTRSDVRPARLGAAR
jgi:Family of unknown function (DUF6600)